MEFFDSLGRKYRSWAPFLLRLGLAIVFILFGFHKLYVPEQTTAEIQILYDFGLRTTAPLNFYTGLLEMGIGIFLISGWRVRLAGLLASGMTFFIFLSFIVKSGALKDPSLIKTLDPNLYRDLGLSAMGLAIFLLGKEDEPPSTATPPQ